MLDRTTPTNVFDSFEADNNAAAGAGIFQVPAAADELVPAAVDHTQPASAAEAESYPAAAAEAPTRPSSHDGRDDVADSAHRSPASHDTAELERVSAPTVTDDELERRLSARRARGATPARRSRFVPGGRKTLLGLAVAAVVAAAGSTLDSAEPDVAEQVAATPVPSAAADDTAARQQELLDRVVRAERRAARAERSARRAAAQVNTPTRRSSPKRAPAKRTPAKRAVAAPQLAAAPTATPAPAPAPQRTSPAPVVTSAPVAPAPYVPAPRPSAASGSAPTGAEFNFER